MDEEEIQAGVQNVKQILAENYVRPDEALDRVSVKLNYKSDIYESQFFNLGIKGVPYFV